MFLRTPDISLRAHKPLEAPSIVRQRLGGEVYICMILITVLVCLLCRSQFYGIGAGTIFFAFYLGRVIHLCQQQVQKHPSFAQ